MKKPGAASHDKTLKTSNDALKREKPSVPLSSSRDRFPCLFIRRSPPLRFTLVPELLALGQSQLHFDSPILEVHSSWNQRQALLLRLADQLANFFAMHQQLSRAQGSMIKDVAVLVGTNMRVQQPDRVVLNQAVRVLQVSQTPSYGLNLGPSQDHPCLKFFQQEIVM